MVQQNVQVQNLKPKYIHFKTNGKTPHDGRLLVRLSWMKKGNSCGLV